MKVKEYLKELGIEDCSCIELTFLECKMIKHEGLKDWYSEFYRSTPIHTIWQWKEHDTNQDMIVLNTKAFHPAWMSGANWNGQIMRNRLMSLLVISQEDMILKYGEKEGKKIEDYIAGKIHEEIVTGNNPWVQK